MACDWRAQGGARDREQGARRGLNRVAAPCAVAKGQKAYHRCLFIWLSFFETLFTYALSVTFQDSKEQLLFLASHACHAPTMFSPCDMPATLP